MNGRTRRIGSNASGPPPRASREGIGSTSRGFAPLREAGRPLLEEDWTRKLQESGTLLACPDLEADPDEVVIDVITSDRYAEAGRPSTATDLSESAAGVLHLDEAVATIIRANPETRLVFEAEPPARVDANEAGMGTIRSRWRWATIL